ncbi:MAG TPA: YoaK family protein [Streptosporangiaceae bacterium]|nr:YoaK family protein [Streptosporangiaceae bacterium]
MTTRTRDVLVVALTLTTGAVDAVTLLRLGNVFSSVITGNLALLGVSAGRHDATLALNGGLALAGYGIGVLAGTPFARVPEGGQPPWPARVTVTLSAELGLLVAFSALWLVSGEQRGTPARLALLMLAAAAMGMQSTAVRRLGQMSSTYLTSTLTGVLSAFALRRVPSEWPRSVGVLAAMVTGAVLGALAAVYSPGWVVMTVLAPLVAVIACSLFLTTT